MPGRARGLGPVVLASALLIGCADLRSALAPELTELIGPPHKRFEGLPAHAAAEVTAAVEPAAAPPPAVVASAAPALVRPPLKDVRELIGLERHELQARLGDPALRRRDAPAEIWQYRSPLCVLDLFLYREGPGMRVTTAEVRPRDGRELPATTCLSSL
ncbi:MAG: hypothetical protein HY060_00510 [Proteobacteria bacterium]|nr:hypothetical protein [Pseudomonadota bacterium]